MARTIDRRRFLVLGGAGVAVVGLSLGAVTTHTPAPVGRCASTPARGSCRSGEVVVTDFGAVGDGRSRPLGQLYPSLDAAREDYPGAEDLDDELDGVAIQAAIDWGAALIRYPTGQVPAS